MKADVDDYNDVLKKFLLFASNTAIINEYLIDCGSPTIDAKLETDEISKSFGRLIYALGDTAQEESANIYSILKYIIESEYKIERGIAMGYSQSSKYKDKLKGFNDRVVLVLIRNIEGYLTKIGIDMGIDDKVNYNITVNNGQVNLATDNATINATVNNGLNQTDLKVILEKVLESSRTSLSGEDATTVQESIEVIENESRVDKPKKTVLRNILGGLKAIKGSTEFSAAVAELIQFLQPVLN
jgi:hypothetical protein